MKENMILNLGVGGQLNASKDNSSPLGKADNAEFVEKFKNIFKEQRATNNREAGKVSPGLDKNLAAPEVETETQKKINRRGRPIIVSENPPTEEQVAAFATLQGIEPKSLEGLVKKDMGKLLDPSTARMELDSKEDTTVLNAVEKSFDRASSKINLSMRPVLSPSEQEAPLGIVETKTLDDNRQKDLSQSARNVAHTVKYSDILVGEAQNLLISNPPKNDNLSLQNGINTKTESLISKQNEKTILSNSVPKVISAAGDLTGFERESMSYQEKSKTQIGSEFQLREEPAVNANKLTPSTPSHKVQIERSIDRMVKMRDQNRALSTEVSKMPPIDLTDTLKSLQNESIDAISAPNFEKDSEGLSDDVSIRLATRDPSGLGEPGTVKLTKSPEREVTLADILKHSGDVEPLTKKMSEMLGQRLLAQITKGAWRVEMDLYPRSLGRVEVQLEMINGHLEAHFHTSQPLTREILSEGISRLKDSLEEFGMESASVSVELGNREEPDKKQTHSTDEEDSDSMRIADGHSQDTTKMEAREIEGRLDFFV